MAPARAGGAKVSAFKRIDGDSTVSASPLGALRSRPSRRYRASGFIALALADDDAAIDGERIERAAHRFHSGLVARVSGLPCPWYGLRRWPHLPPRATLRARGRTCGSFLLMDDSTRANGAHNDTGFSRSQRTAARDARRRRRRRTWRWEIRPPRSSAPQRCRRDLQLVAAARSIARGFRYDAACALGAFARGRPRQPLFPELVEIPVPLTNGSGVFSASLGEFALAAILYFARHFRRMIRNQAAGRWELRRA